jgi:hypothetical protein
MPAQQFYRRLKGDLYWHLSEKCKYWPAENYDEIMSEHPPHGAVCAECIHERLEVLRAQIFPTLVSVKK